MKYYVILTVAVSVIAIQGAQSEFRYKIRGPPAPPRPPLPPHYVKTKWAMPPRYHTRVRPIPVHMPLYKTPVLHKPIKQQFLSTPPKVPGPLVFQAPVWKTPQVYKPIEKPMLSFPLNEPYEFSVSKEPSVNTHTIKQIGEKGPIHTIPAPNLSPADKPAVILEEPLQKHAYHYNKEPELSVNSIGSGSIFGAQALPLLQQNQYQVTEQTDAHQSDQYVQNQFQNPLFTPDQDNAAGKFAQYLDTGALPADLKVFNTDLFVAQPQSNQGQVQLSAQDLYQLLNGMPQQQLIDSYGMPLVQQPQLQQHFMQQAHSAASPSYSVLNSQLYQSEPTYINQVGDSVSQTVKDNFKPQFHTFNYEEQSSDKGYAQSRVTADYNLEPETAENVQSASVQNPNEAVAQSQYIQQYFSTRNDNENNVDPDANPENVNAQLVSNSDISPSMFYSSLPNKETADAFASLQAAGNSNQKESESASQPMKIYVPDDDESYDDMESQMSEETERKPAEQGIKIYETTYAENKQPEKNDSVEYEDYSQEQEDANREGNADELVYNSHTFGNRIRPKNSRES